MFGAVGRLFKGRTANNAISGDDTVALPSLAQVAFVGAIPRIVAGVFVGELLATSLALPLLASLATERAIADRLKHPTATNAWFSSICHAYIIPFAELNSEYVTMAVDRIVGDSPLFNRMEEVSA